MDILFFYILRRFFVSISFRDGAVFINKGLIFIRSRRIPLRAVTSAEIRRTPLLRILCAKKVILRTLGGTAAEFYLSKSEPLPFLPRGKGTPLRPGTSAVLFGAFIDTRALSGVVIFSAAVKRVGAVFGSAYYDRILAAIHDTAEDISQLLSLLHIAVPKAASVLVVFVFSAWIFALLRKMCSMARFRVTLYSGVVMIRRGLFTQRDIYISSALPCCPMMCDTAATMFIKRAPLYLRGEMILPPADKQTALKMVRALLGSDPRETRYRITPPGRALFGHCALPLGWSAGLAAALILVPLMHSAGLLQYVELLKTALWCGIAAFLWTAAVYAAYMFRSGISVGDIIGISSRRFTRLYTVFSRKDEPVSAEIIQNPIQKKDGLCDFRLVFHERVRTRLRQIPADSVRRFVSGL